MAKKVGTNPFKRVNVDKKLQSSLFDEMQTGMQHFMDLLSKDNSTFRPNDAYNYIFTYLNRHRRVLYSAISDYIFLMLKNNKDDKRFDSIISNLDMLLRYSKEENSKNNTTNQNQALDSTSLVILKIWDHVNLANRQFYSLWETDDEYDKRFSDRIPEIQNRIMSEMTGQLLTLVGIFTALAFLIFGSITSLESILDNLGETSLLKVLTSGCLWGLCILNLLFVFLFCIKKLTKTNNYIKPKVRENVFQKYSIVCWSNFIIIALMLLFGWAYIARQCGLDGWIVDIFNNHPIISFFAGTAIIVIIIIVGAILTIKYTANNTSKPLNEKKNK